MAVLVPKLVGLRAELNSVAPNRDKESDGWIGNEQHSKYVSGHNPDESGEAEFQDPDNVDEVRAADLDADLRTPGLTMEECANHLRLKCRSGEIDWIYYLIYYDRIASATQNWIWRPYNGANNHRKHLHVSTNLRGDTAGYIPVGLRSLIEEDEMTLTKEDLRAEGWGFKPGDHPDGKGGLLTAHAIVLNGHTESLEQLTAGQASLAETLSNLVDVVQAIADRPQTTVDAAALAAALVGNQDFLTALATAVADEQFRRLED